MRGGHYKADTQEFRVPMVKKHLEDPLTQQQWGGITTMDPYGVSSQPTTSLLDWNSDTVSFQHISLDLPHFSILPPHTRFC